VAVKSWAARDWRQRAFLVALGSVTVGIGWLALSPAPPPSVDTGWDKLNHLLAFAVFTFIAQGASGRPGRPSLATVTSAFLYGVLIEAVQAWVPGRSSDWQDLLANASGIAVGCGLARWLWGRKPAIASD
jgi:VanZ family protein